MCVQGLFVQDNMFGVFRVHFLYLVCLGYSVLDLGYHVLSVQNFLFCISRISYFVCSGYYTLSLEIFIQYKYIKNKYKSLVFCIQSTTLYQVYDSIFLCAVIFCFVLFSR